MLKKIAIKNFAIIDDIQLEFYNGMTVLTGETGAGKSIIIDAISLLLGERADKTMIRSSANDALISGVFTIESKEVKNILDYNRIDYDNEIEITRVLSKDNQNLIKINNQRSTLKIVNDLAMYLADIHSQFDNNQLINPENYLNLIDNFRKDKVKQYLENYQDKLENYKVAYSDYKKLKSKKAKTLEQLDLYEFQLNELETLELSENELESLQEKVNVLDNIDKINYNLQESFALLNEQGILEKLYIVKSDIDDIAKTSKDFQEISERINNAYYELEDISNTIEDKQETLDYDPNELETMNSRINELEKIQSKYKKTISELIDYQMFLKQSIDEIENFDDLIKQREEKLAEAFKILVSEANQLTELRKTISEKVTKEIISTLKELEIRHADFAIEFNEVDFSDKFNDNIFKNDGVDNLEFLISTNKGEPLKPLAKTASGGEMSRVMLTFKTIFASSQRIPTIIFDEIDTGISGYIAKQIARKIAETAKIAQVISITHIPQVVAQGTNHLAIRKEIINDKTKISVKYLTYDERVEEIAKMVSAEEVTESARSIAKELLINP
ncbi:MAG: DNA repair protein RecN [Candidatus Izimaplasma sp.]|nr:DNA repair protein RecN [Candidatus Izimaplasma bacterium]